MSFKITLKELPVKAKPEVVVCSLNQQPQSFFLDSVLTTHSSCRYSYAGCNPKFIIKGNDNPWPGLLEMQEELIKGDQSIFSGGLVGYLSFESCRYLDDFSHLSFPGSPIPEYWFGFYESVLVLDHQDQKTYLSSSFLNEKEMKREMDRWMTVLSNQLWSKGGGRAQPQRGSFGAAVPLQEEPNYSDYVSKMDKIKEYLKAGDIYQVNLTDRFSANVPINFVDLYLKLREVSPAPYAALINAGDFQVLSASPECFMEIQGNMIKTRPIKGTRRRGKDNLDDEMLINELMLSEKDRAELLMIVDLERNDLGRVCTPSSVKVNSLNQVESYAQVHHLVAEVQGQLKENKGPIEALMALFPGGSVTGAPKKRAVEIINELENKPRSVYTGALGYIGANGCAQFNLPIRTLTKVDDTVYFNAGGGIVIDSRVKSEFDEMKVKASGVMEALGVASF